MCQKTICTDPLISLPLLRMDSSTSSLDLGERNKLIRRSAFADRLFCALLSNITYKLFIMTFCFKVHNHATLDLRFANLLRIKKVISTLFTRKVGFFEFGDKKRSKGIQALMGYLFKNLQYPVMSVKKLKNETSSKGQLSI